MSHTKPSFFDDYEELQQLTKEFEQGNLDLELALPKYKRATELAKSLKTQLNQIETQIKEIDLSFEQNQVPPTETTSSSDDINF